MSLKPIKLTRTFASFQEELIHCIETGVVLNEKEFQTYIESKGHKVDEFVGMLTFLNTPRIIRDCPRLVLTFNRAIIINKKQNGYDIEYIYDGDSTAGINEDALIETGLELNGHVYRTQV